MMIIDSKAAETNGVERIAELMCVAARTAPKGKGIDNLATLIVTGTDKDRLAAEMRRVAQTSGAQFFERDAACVDKAAVVVLLGQKIKPSGVGNVCRYCGYADCSACLQGTGMCAVSIGDLGIAVGSAANAAALHHVDNRIMLSVGRAALNLGFFEPEVSIAYGLPLSVTGKSPFFDR